MNLPTSAVPDGSPGRDALARCRVQHPGWRIVRVDDPDWRGFAAFRGTPGSRDEVVVTAPTVAQLDIELAGR